MNTIVQIDMNGNELKTLNRPVFATTKEEAKDILGSAYKIDGTYVLVADACKKRAYVLDINTDKVLWEYRSNRFLVDCQLIDSSIVYVDIYDDHIEIPNQMLRQGKTITWRNLSSKPVSITEGYTTLEIFESNSNLSEYAGGEFSSDPIMPGEEFSYKFVSVGKYHWFVYPDILTGYIDVKSEGLLETDQFIVVESDNLSAPFSSRVIKIDIWGNVLWTYGEGFLEKPRDARYMINGGILISS